MSKTDSIDDLFTITCFCGHNAPIASYCATVTAGELPPGHFQCPSCGLAWHIKKGATRITKWGLIDERNQIIFEQAHL